MVAVSGIINYMSKKKNTKKKKNAIKKPHREKAIGEPNKIMPLQEYVEKYGTVYNVPKDTMWQKLLKKLGLMGDD